MKASLRFSLRELLLVITFAGLGLASLRLGGPLAAVTIFLAMLLLMAMSVAAAVARGATQASALGFVIPVLLYGAIVYMAGVRELDPRQGQLPTTMLLKQPLSAIETTIWVDGVTGEPIPDYDPATNQHLVDVFFNGLPPAKKVRAVVRPERWDFMTLGHVLFALLFGYAGAKFATALYRRRASGAEASP